MNEDNKEIIEKEKHGGDLSRLISAALSLTLTSCLISLAIALTIKLINLIL